MFGFLKKKIKETSEKIAEEIEEESSIVNEEEITEEEKEELVQEEEQVKKGFFKKLFSKKEKQVKEISGGKENTSEEVIEEKELVEKTTEKKSETDKEKIKEPKITEEVEAQKQKELIKEKPISEIEENPTPKIKNETKEKIPEKEPEADKEKIKEPEIINKNIKSEEIKPKLIKEEAKEHEKENPTPEIKETKIIEKVEVQKKEEPIKRKSTIEGKENPTPEIKEEIIKWKKPKEKKIFGIFKKKEKKKDIPKEKLPKPEEPYIKKQKSDIIDEKSEEIIQKIKKKQDIPIIDPTRKKKNILAKLSEKIKKLNITDEKFEELFWELEVALLENNVAVEVIEKIKSNLKKELKETKITKKTINDLILNNLRNTIESLFNYEEINLLQNIRNKNQQGEPYKILFLGINGSGKTTTLAKLVKYFKDNNMTSVIAAADTFRAAAIQQLEEHANNLNTKIIKHDYGADPAAVAFDAIEHAKSKKAEVVLIDTAGRLHSNSNLIDELKKIVRVSNPDLTIFVGESITGNDCVEQATKFNESIGIDSIILTKADIDEKGGAAISISYVTGKPIIFITTGQEYKDLKKFNPKEIINSIFNE